ncbi:hypothetical protein Gohar_004350 [Gossypium harknessii]|uniref:RNase H type-1 domain-containing protein n=1 Tax=Gossypium harknessii TaxID=34285 RepID=A0A7J9H4M6_9ROSI|nr:hypothetical protein [Gossypium harknessii]
MIRKGPYEEIEQMVRLFIWRSSNGGTKLVLVSWDTVCSPWDHGGLGFQKLQDCNTSFMMRLSFSIVTDSNDLWVWVLRAKYEISNGLPETLSHGRGDGNSIRCWRNPWVSNVGPLASLIPGHSSFDMVIWRISGIPPPHPVAGVDKIIWGCTSTDLLEIPMTLMGWVLFGSLSSSACLPMLKEYIEVLGMIWLMGVFMVGAWEMWSGNVSLELLLGAFRRIKIYSFFRHLDGLTLLIDRGYDNVLIQIDNLEAAQAIQESFSDSSNFALIRRIHQLLSQIMHWSI